MLVAPLGDAIAEDGGAYFSPDLPRLVEPELRSRVIGYLATAPAVGAGHRSDGVWVWPESLVDHVRAQGVGPPPEFADHMASRQYLPPDELAREVVDEAAHATVGPAPAPPRQLHRYFAGYLDRRHPASHVIRRTDGHEVQSLAPHGLWGPSDLMTSNPALAPIEYEEISERQAADLVDRLAERWHERRVRQGRESDLTDADLRVARVFDGESPAGAPWFSPNRLRIAEPARRERMASYLERGRLVLRAAGRAADPFDPARGPVVPLSYRTDGLWVWQEALAYYLRTRGVAPELALLCHAEERSLRLPTSVPDDVVVRSAAVVRAPMPPRPEPVQMSYYASYVQGRPGHLARAPQGDVFNVDSFQRGLRWRSSDVLFRQVYGGGDDDLVEISEEQAIRIIDDRCARDFAELSSN